ncbi:IS110 family transposase [Deinococcus sp. Arct2-2]|nr:IS110 family transposase [Deinococcus sp. Arct2-2]
MGLGPTMISPPILKIYVAHRCVGPSGSDAPSFPWLGATHNVATTRGRISKLGNPRLRRIVYSAAVAATRTKTKEKAFYQRLREQGKPGKVAVIALARKLLCVGFAVVKSGLSSDPEFMRPTGEA